MPDHIVIGDIRPRVQYTADGTQTVFTYPFPIFAAGDLEVYLGEALQSAGYVVNGAGQSAGGTVVFAPTPPPAGAKVTLVRALAIARTSDFQEGGAFRAKTLNDELDRQTAFIQEVGERVERAIVAAPTETAGPLVLPPPGQRAGKFLGFDASGAPIAAVGTGGVPVSAAMVPVVQAATLPEARAALAVPGLGDANLQLTPPLGIGAPAIAQAGLHVGYRSVTVTGSDQDFNAGGGRAILDVDVGSGYARVGGVNGGGGDFGLALIARNTYEATLRNGLAMMGATGGAQGAGTINAQGYFKNGVALSGGKLVQRAFAAFTNWISSSAVIPNDDTIPQDNEGTETVTLSFTPQDAANILRITVSVNATAAPNTYGAAALFRSGVSNARAAAKFNIPGGPGGSNATFHFEQVAGETTSRIWSCRMGPIEGTTVHFNGNSTGRIFGGILAHTMTIEELTP
jgi:hypothetical protein